MTDLFAPLSFSRGPAMKNRFMLAPLTNLQSHADGSLSDAEYDWLVKRAQGGFGLTMTCAAYVQAQGRGFGGQLGIDSDMLLPGLSRLAAAIRAQGSVAITQLHHAGMRSLKDLIGGQPVAPSDDAETGARALTLSEVGQLADDFIAAAVRAEQAGFHGVELHSAHGYVLAQFLSGELNRRSDDYGGSAENRARLLFQIVRGIRERCGKDFMIGVRLSPERFGQRLDEIRAVTQRLMSDGDIDFIDLSLWDVFKEPNEEAFQGKTLLSWFTELERGKVRLTAAGKIRTAVEAQRALDAGLDFVTMGRSGILHHDFPLLAQQNRGFEPRALPVSPEVLATEGVGPAFVGYLRTWAGFVTEAKE